MIEYSIKIKRAVRPFFRDRWVWQMALRDGKKNFGRLFLFVASLITGIAAVVAISSLNYSMQHELDRNAKELLGADLVIRSTRAFDSVVLKKLDTAQRVFARQAEMPSMVMFMNTRQSRLVKLTALQGEFPFYGAIVTQPGNAQTLMKSGRFAMLDEALARQYHISSEDSIKIGNTFFQVAGVVEKFPGGGALTATLAPAVYISMDALDSTRLIQYGSRVNYNLFIKTQSDSDTEAALKTIKPWRDEFGLGADTVEERKRELGEGFGSVYRFFSLLAFIALILGCIGVASSVHIYAREKRDEVAVLRCIGSSGWQAFNIYFIQIAVLGIAGSLAGAAVGVAIQQVVPIVFANYLPVELQFGISWRAAGEGIFLGALVSVLFSILPLVAVRFVPPLSVLRADFLAGRVFSKTRITAIVLILLFPVLAAAYQTKSMVIGVLFAVGLVVALLCLALVAALLLWLVRKYFPVNSRFTFRHALSNLFRPNNQTQVLLVSIGLGAFIVATLNIIQSSLLNQVEFKGNSNQSNTILFDIQPPQREGVLNLLTKYNLHANQVVPIITCRISELKGKPTDQYKRTDADSVRIPNWALTREYRVTYRDSLHSSEKLTKGNLQSYKKGARDSVQVTISEGMHETLKVGVGDSLVFDVQGVPVKAFISGIRKVDWPKDPPNFIFVFPTGVLNDAPQIWVVATKVDEPQQAILFQQELVFDYPNVSLIDLRLILSTVNELFSKVGLVIRFLAMFSIVTGLLVLAGAVLNSKFARMKENVLLRTLGARTRQITIITLIEYGYVGIFSALTGIFLAFASGWLLTKFFFEVEFAIDAIELWLISAGVVTLTVAIGWYNSREVIATPPLQVLRKES
ncbi:MAG: FtsX-like permease family protein [Cytophagales bacterium]|nr:FtsX-like permease family protein [Cytophagales bacterium]